MMKVVLHIIFIHIIHHSLKPLAQADIFRVNRTQLRHAGCARITDHTLTSCINLIRQKKDPRLA